MGGEQDRIVIGVDPADRYPWEKQLKRPYSEVTVVDSTPLPEYETRASLIARFNAFSQL
jgi:hypothetical protein